MARKHKAIYNRSEVLLFGHIYLQRSLLLAYFQECESIYKHIPICHRDIRVKAHYCINIGPLGLF